MAAEWDANQQSFARAGDRPIAGLRIEDRAAGEPSFDSRLLIFAVNGDDSLPQPLGAWQLLALTTRRPP